MTQASQHEQIALSALDDVAAASDPVTIAKHAVRAIIHAVLSCRVDVTAEVLEEHGGCASVADQLGCAACASGIRSRSDA